MKPLKYVIYKVESFCFTSLIFSIELVVRRKYHFTSHYLGYWIPSFRYRRFIADRFPPSYHRESISVLFTVMINRGVYISGARQLWRLNFVWWLLVFVGSQYETCLMSHFWGPEFWGNDWIFRKLVHSSYVIEKHLCCYVYTCDFSNEVIRIAAPLNRYIGYTLDRSDWGVVGLPRRWNE
jgi:hypothetical protein